MKRVIPLTPGNAHLRFKVELSGTLVEVRLDWLTRYGYFTAQVTGPSGVLAAGMGLHPNMDLLVDAHEVPGRLYVEGAVPTVDNLGADSRLVYET